MEICPVCGLPKNICVCKEIAKETQKIKIRLVRRRFGKFMTVISGIEDKAAAKEICKELKRKLACGGTVKNNEIELQGNHVDKTKQLLLKLGYKEELIDA